MWLAKRCLIDFTISLSHWDNSVFTLNTQPSSLLLHVLKVEYETFIFYIIEVIQLNLQIVIFSFSNFPIKKDSKGVLFSMNRTVAIDCHHGSVLDARRYIFCREIGSKLLDLSID